jgi:cytochrome c553
MSTEVSAKAKLSLFRRTGNMRVGAAPALLSFILAPLVLAAFLVAGCRKGMVDQQKLKPLAEENFFADRRASRMPPRHTVARGELRADEQFYTGKIGDHDRFDIYCAVCHGLTGEGNGMIVERGFPAPPSLHEQRLRDAPVGHFFNVITNGYGVMYSYASRVAPEDRWAIAAYIRALQFSQHATSADADALGARQLEAAQR